MKLSEFEYELPPELIAQQPAERRDAARMLAHAIGTSETRHVRVRDLTEFLRPGDLLVVNDTRVLPSRLYGRRATGGKVELLLIGPVPDPLRPPGGAAGDPCDQPWTALVQPARKLRPAEVIELEGGALNARMLSRCVGAGGEPTGEWRVQLTPGPRALDDETDTEILLERHGHMPLPPYIRRAGSGPRQGRDGEGSTGSDQRDRERYQTIFARQPGAVAAPTAGLHFTPDLLADLGQLGVESASVTLHVGHGTFLPVQCEDVEEHRMHGERFELSADLARAVNATRERGGRVVAVGTTSVRVLESCAVGEGRVAARTGVTELFLLPGSNFRVVDAILTNFHLPRSSLLMLVSAFAGKERIRELYLEAVRERYRFYSYGDAMFLHSRPGPRA